MEVYILVLFLCIFCFFITSIVRGVDLLVSVTLIFALLLVSGFRYKVGTDFNTYLYFIELIRDGHDTYMEPGFELMVRFLTSSGFEEQSIFLISSLLTLTFFYLFIIKHSKQYTLSVVIFYLFPIFYLASFNGVRQFIAVSIFLYSIRFILANNFISYFTLIVAASFIHKTVLLMLPVYFLLNIKINNKRAVIISVLYIGLINFLPFVGRALGFPEKYFSDALVTDGNNFKALIFPLIFAFYCFIEKRYQGKCKDENVTYNMLLIGSLISITPLMSSLPSAPVIRMSSYFTPIVIVLLANAPFVFKSLSVKLFYYTGVVIVSILYFSSTVLIGGEKFNLVPYSFNFQIL
ncbi:EpsG family protein [Aeromonas veronii]